VYILVMSGHSERCPEKRGSKELKDLPSTNTLLWRAVLQFDMAQPLPSSRSAWNSNILLTLLVLVASK
jgi:hypothetical protein